MKFINFILFTVFSCTYLSINCYKYSILNVSPYTVGCTQFVMGKTEPYDMDKGTGIKVVGPGGKIEFGHFGLGKCSTFLICFTTYIDKDSGKLNFLFGQSSSESGNIQSHWLPKCKGYRYKVKLDKSGEKLDVIHT